MAVAREKTEAANVGCRRRVFQGLKLLAILLAALIVVFGSLSIIGRLITRRLEPETDRHALAPWGPGTSFITTETGETHVLDVGEGDAILLIHGSTGSIADWQETIVDRLADSYRIVAFDSYGFGLSERNNSLKYGHALWEEQAVDVLDALGIERAVVVGHSAGAMTAVLVAADYPERVRGVVLTGHSFSGDPTQMLPFLPGVGELLMARQTMIGDAFSESYRARAEAVHRIRGTRAAYLAFMRGQYTAATSFRLFDSGYEDIQVPVLQMHGTLDQAQDIEAARELSSRMADTRFVAFEGSDHFIHIADPERWAREVSAFVDSLGP